jgi:hypothetical protein
MSAYLLDPKELAMITRAAFHMSCKPRALFECYENSKAFALALARENINSVEYRYPDLGPCAGLVDDEGEYICEIVKELPYAINRDGAKGMYNLLAKYEYNACEHPGWNDNDANPVKMVISAMMREAARKMAAHIEEEEEHVSDLIERVEDLRGVIANLKAELVEKNAKLERIEAAFRNPTDEAA